MQRSLSTILLKTIRIHRCLETSKYQSEYIIYLQFIYINLPPLVDNKYATPPQASVNMESDFTSIFLTRLVSSLSAFFLSLRQTLVILLYFM